MWKDPHNWVMAKFAVLGFPFMVTDEHGDNKVNRGKIIESVISGIVIAAILGIISYAKFLPDIETNIKILGYKIEEHQRNSNYAISSIRNDVEDIKESTKRLSDDLVSTRADVIRLKIKQNMQGVN
jgi:uncharacterized protein YsxB (DUF464 family)